MSMRTSRANRGTYTHVAIEALRGDGGAILPSAAWCATYLMSDQSSTRQWL